ncbi:MAG: hypothetical protein PHN47_08860 [Clostridia bacterium]|nr:hypothetical protein [Clostridia bacterium]
MEIWVILALIVALTEIFGKKNQKKQPPKTTQKPEDYQEYNYEEYDYDEKLGRQKPSVEPVERPMQEKSVGLPKWLEEAMKKAASEAAGKAEWQDMIRPEPIQKEKREPIILQEPLAVASKTEPKPIINKTVLPSAKTATVTFEPSPKVFLEKIVEEENTHHVFEGKTMQDIKQIIVMSELLGPPLALRKRRRLI